MPFGRGTSLEKDMALGGNMSLGRDIALGDMCLGRDMARRQVVCKYISH